MWDTLEAKWSFQTFQRSLSDWFGPKCKCKFSTYMDNNTRVPLSSRLHLRFNLNYLVFFISNFVHLE